MIARWNSVDPLVEVGQESTSPYIYVLNNPIRLTDPDGRLPDPPDDGPLGNGMSVVENFIYDIRDKAVSGIVTLATYALHKQSNGVLPVLKAEFTYGPDGRKGRAALVQESIEVEAVAGIANIVSAYPSGGVTAGLFTKTVGVPSVIANEIKAIDETTKYTKSNLKLGQEMHKAYKAEDVVEGVAIKEFREVKGIRPDFVNLKTKTIFELKPNNPRAIKQGTKQLNNYKKLFDKEYGGSWATKLDLY